MESRVTQGVIICDVETDMASYHTHTLKYTPLHLCTAIWSLVHICMTLTMCVFTELWMGSPSEPWVE